MGYPPAPVPQGKWDGNRHRHHPDPLATRVSSDPHGDLWRANRNDSRLPTLRRDLRRGYADRILHSLASADMTDGKFHAVNAAAPACATGRAVTLRILVPW
jgi:hypothetical protein